MGKINIAIDGPAGAGKSTIAKKAASELGFIYVDTGALYRTVGVFALEEGVKFDDIENLKKLLDKTVVRLKYEDGVQKVYCNGSDYSGKIRTPEASLAASDISKIPLVREYLLSLQRDIASENDCVMDGRDIGTVVLPDAKIKIFLTADVEDRAQRRYKELLEKGEEVDFDDVLEDMKKRDYQDSHREIAPLKPAADSVLVNTTGFTLDEAISLMLKTIKDRL
ncbi:MAG: (d)CMP kinase [Clostridia bacterium]|nr:(d)CMP kinase [Clostridia bacterium]